MKCDLVCLVALASTAAIVCPGAAKAADSNHLIVILGASTASGVGAIPISQSFARRYADYAAKLQPAYRVVNLAVGGYNTYQFLPDGRGISQRMHPDSEHNITKALSLHPEIVVLCMPTNDMAGRIPVAETENNLRVIAEEARKAHVEFWVTTSPPRNLDDTGRRNLTLLNVWIRKYFGPRSIDFSTGLVAPDGKMLTRVDSGDGVHPNNVGHDLLLQRLLAAHIERG